MQKKHKKLLRYSKRLKVLLKKFFKNNIVYKKFYNILSKFDRKFLIIPKDMLKFFKRFIDKDNLCFDIGAWEGEYTELFLRLGARVVSVEPQIRCFKKLELFLNDNDKVKLLNKAIGEKKGLGEIVLTKYQTQKSTISQDFIKKSRHSEICKWEETQPIKITTLDSLIKKFGTPKFCKIDVEGYEAQVIKGLTQKIPIISFEFHKELLYIVEECLNHLNKIGEIKSNCVINPEKYKFSYKNWMNPEELLYNLKQKHNEFIRGDIYVKYEDLIDECK